ncbi:RNA polymerase sigma factor FliA [Ramlibacter sp. MAHUQ-53]|uniref:RNA polymerase sigma factor FliA n=1 Tax=unclassified Ramlibacter TaxID=2617605 RepID=UPI0036376085
MDAALDLYDDTAGRQENLVLSHMPMVKRVAIHLKGRIPPLLDLDELVQLGMLGLIEAARGYDPRRGIPFEHFALSRVRGAMLDELRRVSDLSRASMTFNREENAHAHKLVAELGRLPTQAELAQSMGKDIAEFHKEQGQAWRSETFSIEEVTEEVMGIAGDAQHQPEVQVERAQLLEALAEAISELPERDQLIISLYYVEELNLKEIGEILGVSESRISQLLSAIAKKLRAELQPGSVPAKKAS